jgi:hypothetical protein
MNIAWPVALVIVAIVFGAVTLLATQMAAKTVPTVEEAKAKSGEAYRALAADYEKLARETQEVEKAIQSDVAELREKIVAIEKMMREVG